MSLLQNLAQGFANAAGATAAANDIQADKNRRAKMSDEALEDTVQAHMDVMKGLQTRLGQNPNDPELQKALAGERDQLFQLLHPANNPDALGRVKKLFRHVFRQPDPTPNQPVNNLPSVASMTAAAPQDEFSGLSPDDRTKAQRIKLGLDPRAINEKPDPENWQVVTGVTADGKPFTFQHNSKSGESQTLDGKPIPPEQMQGFTVPPKGSAGPKVGSLGAFLVASYGEHPTAQQQAQGRALWAQANAGTTVGEHVVMVPQLDGTIKPVTVTTTSAKTFPGAGSGTPSTPKPPGQQKKDLQGMTKKPGAGMASVGDAVGGKRTTAQNKADNDVVEATKLSSIADQVAQKPDDAINQKRLAVALERASAGRFTVQALDYIIKAGWGNTIEQWANNPSTGALPQDVMRQLVEGAHQNLKAAKDARAEAFGQPSSGQAGDDMISVQIPGQPPGKIHKSQKDAFLRKYPNATVY